MAKRVHRAVNKHRADAAVGRGERPLDQLHVAAFRIARRIDHGSEASGEIGLAQGLLPVLPDDDLAVEMAFDPLDEDLGRDIGMWHPQPERADRLVAGGGRRFSGHGRQAGHHQDESGEESQATPNPHPPQKTKKVHRALFHMHHTTHQTSLNTPGTGSVY